MSADLTPEQASKIGRGYCPDCGYRGFVLGPRGGAAINIECGSGRCRSRFNIVAHPYAHGVIIHADRIPKECDGGGSWASRKSRN